MSAYVQDVVVGREDFAGLKIVEIYGKVSGRYAVYRNERHVMIHFSDDDAEGINQRSSLTPLLPLRSVIASATSKLCANKSPYQLAKAAEYNARLGAALVVALQGDVALAASDLQIIAADLHEDRASDIRTRHILWAAAATAMTVLLASVVASQWFMNAFSGMNADEWPHYWHAASIGAFGALFSISLQLRARQVRVDIQPWDNISDAVLRILVGATSAVILTALLKAAIVDVRFAGQPVATSSPGFVIVAFAGGFAERLVAEFLTTMGLAGRAQPVRATAGGLKVENEQALAAGAAPPSRQHAGAAAGAGQQPAEPAPILTPDSEPREEAELAPDEDETDYRGQPSNHEEADELRPVG